MCDISCVVPNEVEPTEAVRFKNHGGGERGGQPASFTGALSTGASPVLVRAGGVLVGLGALKRPYQERRNAVFSRAQASLSADLR